MPIHEGTQRFRKADYVENTGYDDVGDSDEGLVSESVTEEKVEYYDDITTDEKSLIKMTAMEVTKLTNGEEMEYYDDITSEENDLKLTAGMVTADQPQEDDGVITRTDYDDVGVESEE